MLFGVLPGIILPAFNRNRSVKHQQSCRIHHTVCVIRSFFVEQSAADCDTAAKYYLQSPAFTTQKNQYQRYGLKKNEKRQKKNAYSKHLKSRLCS